MGDEQDVALVSVAKKTYKTSLKRKNRDEPENKEASKEDKIALLERQVAEISAQIQQLKKETKIEPYVVHESQSVLALRWVMNMLNSIHITPGISGSKNKMEELDAAKSCVRCAIHAVVEKDLPLPHPLYVSGKYLLSDWILIKKQKEFNTRLSFAVAWQTEADCINRTLF
jgi:hypothetical protein